MDRQSSRSYYEVSVGDYGTQKFRSLNGEELQIFAEVREESIT